MIPTSTLPAPRLQWKPTSAGRTLLDGGWWPRSADPVTELPGLMVALDERCGRLVTRLMLGAAGWDSRPRRMNVAGRVVRLGWFASLPVGLLTAIWRNGDRVDLLVVPPDTTAASAAAAMSAAADVANTLHAPDILAAVIDRGSEGGDGGGDGVGIRGRASTTR